MLFCNFFLWRTLWISTFDTCQFLTDNCMLCICFSVRKFNKVTALCKSLLQDENGEDDMDTCTDTQTVPVYMAAVNWLKEHPCKGWFECPVQVWQKFNPCSSADAFIPVSNVLCRCAYTNKTVKFNQLLEESVTVVVPINHFSGLI